MWPWFFFWLDLRATVFVSVRLQLMFESWRQVFPPWCGARSLSSICQQPPSWWRRWATSTCASISWELEQINKHLFLFPGWQSTKRSSVSTSELASEWILTHLNLKLLLSKLAAISAALCKMAGLFWQRPRGGRGLQSSLRAVCFTYSAYLCMVLISGMIWNI